MPTKRGLLVFLLALILTPAFGQEIAVKAVNTPLNQVLVGLRDGYGLQLSFDNRLLAGWKVTQTATFPSPEQAIESLIQEFPLKYEKMGNVFVIYETHTRIRDHQWIVSGIFRDIQTAENLPFTHVQINGKGMLTDQQGWFSFVSPSDSLFHLQASYLGYYVLDTLLSAGTNHRFNLYPSNFELPEIQVEGKVNHSLQVGFSPGVLRLNHQVSGFLPGYGDNSVFNLLRLQPGILASGEQSNDLIIWGSYEGQSQVIFDGIPLYGMKNFNDNISAVNPFMAKDIQVLKGGFGAEYGERVGGLVNITGIDGSLLKPEARFSLNNTTLNGMVTVPVAPQASLVAAMRQTYYGLYDPYTFAGSGGRGYGYQKGGQNNYTVFPDYHFHDFNLKFSGRTAGGADFSVGSLYGKDHFSYAMDQERSGANTQNEADEKNEQAGIAASLGKTGNNGNRTQLSLAWSGLQKSLFNLTNSGRNAGRRRREYASLRDEHNKVGEFSLKLGNTLTIAEGHRLEGAVGVYRTSTGYRSDSLQVRLASSDEQAFRWMGFVQDQAVIGKALSLKAGLRLDYTTHMQKLWLQPRLSATLKLDPSVRLNAAWGLYNQFVVRSSVVDELDNYHYRWMIADDRKKIPVPESEHTVAGITWNRRKSTLSAEGFYKTTRGLIRFVSDQEQETVWEGESRSMGMDLFFRTEYRRHLFWIAYTLGRTEEKFPYFSGGNYQRSLHDQRHEFKCALVSDLKPFHFSLAFVYGSGFPDPASLDQQDVYEYPYQRLDAALIYRFGFKKLKLDAGVSVLNVFNAKNLKYADFIRIPDEQEMTLQISQGAVPFMPNLFINLAL